MEREAEERQRLLAREQSARAEAEQANRLKDEFLAIVRHLVELHGGTARAESKGEGKGSTFTIRLPLADAGRRTRTRRAVARTDAAAVALAEHGAGLAD